VSKIILSGQFTATSSLYASLVDLERQIEIAMVQIPSSMEDAHKPTEEQKVIFVLLNPTEVKIEEMNFTRYELHSHLWVPGTEPPEKLSDLDTIKGGYVFLPKTLRDGQHAEQYLLAEHEKSTFTFRVENGMYEEVYWSPFGDGRGALQQEQKNAEINPQLRRYDRDGLD